MDEQGQGATRAVEFRSDGNVTKSIAGMVKARDVHLTGSGAGVVAADGDVSILKGGCGPVVANGGVTMRYGGCGPLIAGGDVSIENGGTQAILAAGGVTIGRKAFAGIVVSPRLTVEEGGRVLMSGPLALVVAAGAGIAVALLSRAVRR